MINERPSHISVIDPISLAIERSRLILFRPFAIEKWFIIGFCAWLANLGSSGRRGGGGNFTHGNTGNGTEEFKHVMMSVKDYILANLSWIIPLVIIGLALFLIIWALLIWLSSRGRFMFLHCVARNKAEVIVPWNKYRHLADSLFSFRIVLSLMGFVLIIPTIILIVISIISIISKGAAAAGILGIVFLGISLFIISTCLALTGKFTTDFVVPVMLLRNTGSRAAWKEFLSILLVNKARFFLYILFQIVIGFMIGIIIIALALVTCCCFCCLSAIPFIGTVLLLPVHIFERAYSLYYLSQFGPQFNVFAEAAGTESPDDNYYNQTTY